MFKKIDIFGYWKNLNLNVYVVSYTALVNLTLFFTWWAILPLYFRQLGANDFQIAVSYSVIGVSFTLFQFLGGILGDRIGRKFVIVATTLLCVPLYIILAFLKDWHLFLLVLAMGESLSALQSPCFVSIIGESADSSSQGKAFSFFEVSITLALLLGPASGAVLFKFISVPVLITASGIICFFTGIIRLKYLRETIHTYTLFDLKGLKNYLNKNLFWAITGLSFLSMIVGLTIYGPFLAIFAKDVYSFDKSQINLMFAFGALLAVIFGPFLGHWVDKFGIRRFLIIGAILHALFLFLWSKSFSVTTLFILFALSGAPLEMAFIAKNKFLTKLTPQKYRGTLIGFIGAVTGTAGAAAPILGKLSQNLWGKSAPFLLAIIFALLLGVTLLPVKLKELPE